MSTGISTLKFTCICWMCLEPYGMFFVGYILSNTKGVKRASAMVSLTTDWYPVSVTESRANHCLLDTTKLVRVTSRFSFGSHPVSNCICGYASLGFWDPIPLGQTVASYADEGKLIVTPYHTRMLMHYRLMSSETSVKSGVQVWLPTSVDEFGLAFWANDNF